MPEENRNLERPRLKIIRKITKWSGIFLIAIVIAGGLGGGLGLLLILFNGPAILGLGIILILIERILKKPPLREIIILLFIFIVVIIFASRSFLLIVGDLLVKIAAKTTDSRIGKITAEAVKSKNPEECYKILPEGLIPKRLLKFIPMPYTKEDWHEHLEKCIIPTAIAANDETLCEKFPPPSYGEPGFGESIAKCKAKVAVEKKDRTICEKIGNTPILESEKDFRDRCTWYYLVMLAADTQDPEICSQIDKGEFHFAHCIYGVAIKTGRIELCDRIDKDIPFAESSYLNCKRLDPREWCFDYFCD
jgi:hypothetical protein